MKRQLMIQARRFVSVVIAVGRRESGQKRLVVVLCRPRAAYLHKEEQREGKEQREDASMRRSFGRASSADCTGFDRRRGASRRYRFDVSYSSSQSRKKRTRHDRDLQSVW